MQTNGVDYLKKHKNIRELSRSQRYAHGPTLDKIFPPVVLKDIQKRNCRISEAVEKYGYTQRAIADPLGMHFTYVNQIMNR